MHGLWIPAAGIVAAGCLVGWLGAKAMKGKGKDGPQVDAADANKRFK
jgi:hypothetical protein